MLAERIQSIQASIQQACHKVGRSSEEVNLIAVTKSASLLQTKSIVAHGLTHLGESRWQQAKEKWQAIQAQASWHFIGHLQTNKVKYLMNRFSYIHSLDTVPLAQAIQYHAEKNDLQLSCFVQVNVSQEVSKYGLYPEQVIPFLQQISSYSNLRLIGLMTMAPFFQDVEQARPIFRSLCMLKEEINQQAVLPNPMMHLSMGMSNDFHIAIEEGATWVRIGTKLVEESG